MASLNMANMNTLFRKGYLLAGVMMAANMFVGNEMKATDNRERINMDENTEKNEEGKDKDASSIESVLNFVLSRENTINLIGGVVFSGANNYLKWWDYNAGSYCNLRIGCLGWRSKKFFDIVQVDINLNVGRGISWVILGAYNFIKFFTVNDYEKEGYVSPLHFSFLVACRLEKPSPTIALILSFLFQGFVSAPLIFHISNFSIAISLDSMIWGITGFFLDKGKNNEKEEEGGKEPDINEQRKKELNDGNPGTTTS